MIEHNHFDSHRSFWRDVFAISGTTTWRSGLQVAFFGTIALILCVIDSSIHLNIALEATLMEFAGAALGLLLVLRTNEGYGRWWEARKLWGSLVNNSRNLAIESLAYGPADDAWRAEIVRWIASFSHACRYSLRGERDIPDIARLVGESEAALIASSAHMPTYTAFRISQLCRRGIDLGMNSMAFLRLETERAYLIDQIGACERILKTPLPWVYAVQLRRFIAIYLVTLPLGLITKLGWWPTPFVTMMVAYPILGLDSIAVALQNPFSKANLNHLPLDKICNMIETDLLGLEASVRQEYPAEARVESLA